MKLQKHILWSAPDRRLEFVSAEKRLNKNRRKFLIMIQMMVRDKNAAEFVEIEINFIQIRLRAVARINQNVLVFITNQNARSGSFRIILRRTPNP